MNTSDEKIQWHPAFDAALQIELGEETKYLEFDSEHLLSKKPMQIDVLVKNERHVKIQKNIGRIFRQYNVVEYKSPEDDLNIDDFYKVYAYACIYKADTETVDFIPAAELTITFVCYHYPRTMLQKLQRDRQITVENMEAVNLMGAAIHAHWQELKEERKMCEALRELFADDLRESREEGIMEGRNVGKREGKLEGKREGEASKVIEIVIKKYKKGCSVKETADMLEEPQTLIKQIYDVIGQCAPDYNVEAIYKILLDKTI